MSEAVRKLKIENYKDKLIMNKPDNVSDFEAMSFDESIMKAKYDIVIAFVFSLDEFLLRLTTILNKDLLNPNGYAYFVYPKKGNREYADYIGRDDFFGVVSMDNDGYVNDSQVKFAKMVAFNDTFTAVWLKHHAKRKQKSISNEILSSG